MKDVHLFPFRQGQFPEGSGLVGPGPFVCVTGGLLVPWAGRTAGPRLPIFCERTSKVRQRSEECVRTGVRGPRSAGVCGARKACFPCSPFFPHWSCPTGCTALTITPPFCLKAFRQCRCQRRYSRRFGCLVPSTGAARWARREWSTEIPSVRGRQSARRGRGGGPERRPPLGKRLP